MGAIRDGLDELEEFMSKCPTSPQPRRKKAMTYTHRILKAMQDIEAIFGVKIEDFPTKGKLANVLCNLVLDAQHDTKVADDIRHTAALLDGMNMLDQPERVRSVAPMIVEEAREKRGQK